MADADARAEAQSTRADKAEQEARDLFRENADLSNRIRQRAGLEQAKGLLVEQVPITSDFVERLRAKNPAIKTPMDAAGEVIRLRARNTERTIYAVGDDIVAHLGPQPARSQPGRPLHTGCAVCGGQAMDSGPVSEWRAWGAACKAYHLDVRLWDLIALDGDAIR